MFHLACLRSLVIKNGLVPSCLLTHQPTAIYISSREAHQSATPLLQLLKLHQTQPRRRTLLVVYQQSMINRDVNKMRHAGKRARVGSSGSDLPSRSASACPSLCQVSDRDNWSRNLIALATQHSGYPRRHTCICSCFILAVYDRTRRGGHASGHLAMPLYIWDDGVGRLFAPTATSASLPGENYEFSSFGHSWLLTRS